MKIVRSRYAGACYGVERALSLVNDAASKHAEPVYTLGPLIHNPQVVNELRERGVEQADTVEQVVSELRERKTASQPPVLASVQAAPPNNSATLVIRSHGVAPAVIQQACAAGLHVVDATCPHVSKAHEAARQLREQGYLVVVVGELGHPEVEGIRAYAGDEAIVVQEPSDLPLRLSSNRIGIVVQTTQTPTALEAIISALQRRGITPTVRNTICFATQQRQKAATELAAQVSTMLVVGGRNSGNTTRLAQLCRAVCPRTHHVESPVELDPAWFKGADTVGITAGASTPEAQIIAVEQALRALTAVSAPTPARAPAPTALPTTPAQAPAPTALPTTPTPALTAVSTPTQRQVLP
ncbi:MAG: 4-hydroxy-3-methylbut-2-enyl diphosphate reductase [Coriobacteriales bacterium]|jgi:4-hydroxy-3-methylbut-2-enyl diphosphate reductase|nr:4-hydroxy-3-methylbut-2-enyl diphosphate reductase [Coriobacteriales bacterium]